MLKGLSRFNLPEIEEKVLRFWKEQNIFAKSLEQRKGKTPFVFYEGPPTANGRPGTHHVVGRVFKDIIPRFKTMRGQYVLRRAGWDTHGLPVEIEVEKMLGIKNKAEIEKFGIAEFNKKARELVWKYKDDWEKLVERIGFWLDTEHPYITYDNGYMERVWGIIRQIDKRKLLYKGHKVVPWCTRCGSALSSHELAQGYKEVTDTGVYVKFKIRGASRGKLINCNLLVWTTTPWTLPGNVALAINPKHVFVLVDEMILEKSSAMRLGFDVSGAEEILAKKLTGMEYEPLFKVESLRSKKSYKIYPADFVIAGEGTGIVHTAVMYGEDDYGLGLKIGLPQRHTVDERGMFTEDVPELAGLYVKSKATEEKIIKHLAVQGRIFKTESYTHEYPFCWRCDTPVLYYATDSWFIAMSTLRAKLMAANKRVRWLPEHIKNGRFGEWLREAKDWALSRARYWGTPLPIWECGACGHYAVVGSADELKKLGGAVPDDLHRPFIDLVTLRCMKCKKGSMARVKEVIDVWFDSGAMPFASEEYPERYPADYICEAIDQTRGWFYTLLAIAVALGHEAPYRQVICYSHVLDTHGKKMSKSKGNIVDPWNLINTYGIDALRWYFYTSAIVKEAICFNERDVVKKSRQFISLLYNSYVFLETYGGGPEAESRQSKAKQHILDTWIIARLNQTIREATGQLEAYDIAGAAAAIEQLADDLSRWHIRRSRKRAEALPVLRHVLLETSKLIAPFMPFFAEGLYQSLRTQTMKDSVHLEDWPKADKKAIHKTLINGMAEVRRVASIALAKRAASGIRVRQPLAMISIPHSASSIPKALLEILKDEVNVKKIAFDKKLHDEVVLDTHITAELRKEGLWREMVRLVQGLRQEAGCAPGDLIEVFIEGGVEVQAMIEERTGAFLREVSARSVSFGKGDAVAASGAADFDGIRVEAGIRKLI